MTQIKKSTKSTNSCALRMSKSLNYSGVTIPYKKGQTGSGDDGKWYFYTVKNVTAFLYEEFGDPDIVISPTDPDFYRIISESQGIMIFDVSGWTDATGHATVWNGTECGDHCYFPSDLGSAQELKQVKIWIFE